MLEIETRLLPLYHTLRDLVKPLWLDSSQIFARYQALHCINQIGWKIDIVIHAMYNHLQSYVDHMTNLIFCTIIVKWKIYKMNHDESWNISHLLFGTSSVISLPLLIPNKFIR